VDTINTPNGPEERRINYFRNESDFRVDDDFQTSKRRKIDQDRPVSLYDQAEYVALMEEFASSMDVDRAVQVEMLSAIRINIDRRWDEIPGIMSEGHHADAESIKQGYGILWSHVVFRGRRRDCSKLSHRLISMGG
jgi:hypothetical protein